MIGDLLKQAREKKGLTLREIEDETNMRWKYLEALENEEFDVIPGETYVKGFLRNYSAFLGLDPDPMLELYRERLNEQEKSVAREQRIVERQQKRKQKKETTTTNNKPALLLAGILSLVVVAGIWAFTGSNAPGPEIKKTPSVQNKEEKPSTQQAKPAPKPSTNQGTKPAPSKPQPSVPTPPVTQPAPVGQGPVNVTFRVVDQESWFLVKVDGNKVFEGTLRPGETKAFSGKAVWARVGNAGAVSTLVNNQDTGFLGVKGQVVEKEFTP